MTTRYTPIISVLLIALTLPASASANIGAPLAAARASVRTSRAAASQVASGAATLKTSDSFERFVKRQAALEVQTGLRLYAAYDDYRAITAMRRYQILAAEPQATFLSQLIIGQIYHRNEKFGLAAYNFEQAVKVAPDTPTRAWVYLLTVQELCLPLSLYFECRNRLNDAVQIQGLTPEQRELIDYQRLYVDVVLRSEYVTPQRAKVFSDPELVRRAEGLIARDAAFDSLKLKRPWAAGVLSGVLPGAGQAYNGRWVDAGVAFGLNAGLGALLAYSLAGTDSLPLQITSGLVFASFYAGNIVNAVTDAKRINAERYLSFFGQLKVDYWARIRFGVRKNVVQFGYVFDWPGDKPPQGAPKPSAPQSVEPVEPEPGEEMF
ncbi:MAG: hypothetical protein AAGI01_03195 [Myxococcota bacterium]